MLTDLQATNPSFENLTGFHYIIFQISPFCSLSELQATHLLCTEAGLVYSFLALSFSRNCSHTCCLPFVWYQHSSQQQGTRPHWQLHAALPPEPLGKSCLIWAIPCSPFHQYFSKTLFWHFSLREFFRFICHRKGHSMWIFQHLPWQILL